MNNSKKTDPLEKAIYAIVLIIGISSIAVSYYQEDFTQNLLLSLGTNLTVVTIVFMIFEFFRRREQLDSRQEKNTAETNKKDFPPDLQKKLESRSVNLQRPHRDDYGEKDEK